MSESPAVPSICYVQFAEKKQRHQRSAASRYCVVLFFIFYLVILQKRVGKEWKSYKNNWNENLGI